MGFTSGFTGGVTLTLSLAYLTVLAHQRSREQQGAALRAQSLAVQQLLDPLPAPLPPTRSESAAAQRDSAVEVAKDRWNHEVENAVRWAQGTDWTEVREGLEQSASQLWARAVGQPVERAEEGAGTLARAARTRSEEAAGGVAAAARGAFDRAGKGGEEIQASAHDRALEARLRAKSARITAKEEISKAEDAVEDTASETKGVIASALDKGREIVDLAKTKAGIAEDKLDVKSDEKMLPAATPVERALHQRYERPEAKSSQTVAGALKERYIPLDQRDNTMLRGL